VFGDVPAAVASDRPAPVPVAGPRRLAVADRPGAVQSTLRIGHPTPSRFNVPEHGVDVVALRIGSTILGGSFTSRLNHELREVKGYTYGAAARSACTPCRPTCARMRRPRRWPTRCG
jgi:predicted Zn-dependent peptidase